MNKTGFFFGVMTGIAAFFACAYFMNTAGCDRTTSPFSGKLATSDEIKSEAESLIRSVAADNEKAQHEAQAKIDSAKRKANVAMAKLNATQVSEAAVIQADLEEAVGSASRQSDESSAAFKVIVEDTNAKVGAAQAKIEANKKLLNEVWSVARPYVGMIPVAGAQAQTVGDDLMKLVTGGSLAAATAAVLRARSNGKAARSIVNGIDKVRSAKPEVAAAMKELKGEILGQLTDRARVIIRDESIT